MDYKIPYGRQHITQEDLDAVNQVLTSDYLTTGPRVKEFEDLFADYVDAKFAVAVSNGTAALHLCAMALGVNEKSKVITTPITFAASANCVRYCGGEIDFCDIDPESLTMDLDKLNSMLESAPEGTYEGVIPVDFAGRPVDLEKLREIADRHNLWIIEDACHAPGGSFVNSKGEDHKCGNGQYADLAIFSFHPVKHIACGEGGMITTNDEDLYHKLIQLRSHGMIYQGNDKLIENHGGWYMELQDLGYNYRIPDILCALGSSQLKRAEEGLKKRREIAKKYDEAFSGTGIKTHVPPSKFKHAFHLYVVQVDDRKKVYDELRKNGIFAQIHYIPLHTMPYYKALNKYNDLSESEQYYKNCLSLPMYPTLTDKEQDFVIKTILNLIK